MEIFYCPICGSQLESFTQPGGEKNVRLIDSSEDCPKKCKARTRVFLINKE